MEWDVGEVVISIVVLLVVAVLITVAVIEHDDRPCMRYENRTIMVYNAQLKTSVPQTTRVCVERAAH